MGDKKICFGVEKMKFLIFIIGIVSITATELSPRSQFEAFKQQFGKTYRNEVEELERFLIFENTLQEIEDHNRAGKGWKKGLNQFADWTREEFNDKLNGYVHMTLPQTPLVAAKDVNIRNLPDSVDWRDQGAISEMKDQGFCGSCWAFAAIESIESYLQINSDKPVEKLSAEHITACSTNGLQCGGGGGCEGSVTQLGFIYAQLFGLVTEQDYPYLSGNYGYTESCTYDPNSMEALATLRGYEVLPRNHYATVMNHLANVGPLSVAVAAGDWSYYRDGVFDGCSYDSNIEINHAVQLVGYGTDPTEGDYWIIRNSWGTWWGENGYMKLKREADAPCGTDNTPLMGSGCVNDGKNVLTVCGQCGVLYDPLYPIGVDYVQAA